MKQCTLAAIIMRCRTQIIAARECQLSQWPPRQPLAHQLFSVASYLWVVCGAQRSQQLVLNFRMELSRPAQRARHSSAWQEITQEGKTRNVGLPPVPSPCTSNLALSHAPLFQPLQCKAAPVYGFQGAVLDRRIAGSQVSVDAHSEWSLVSPQVLPPPSHVPVACEEWEGAEAARAV